ncbi:MAG TPA: ATP-binding protein [Pyrinomonadaceae bacterium]|nr:ATP-binding protein [Pyrinomonadaceae bacterium]
MDQTEREFLIEIEELVEQIFADLDELRATKTEGRARRELIDQVFRRVHSVKGSAASAGLEVVSHIAHEFENLLDEVRAGRVRIDDSVVNTCESATEALSESLSLAASGIVEPSRRALFDQLQAAAQAKTASELPDSEAILKNIPFEIWESLTEAEKQKLLSVVGEGSPLFVVATSFDLGNFDAEFSRLKEKLRESGEVISTSPKVDHEHPDKINFRILYAGTTNLETLQAAVSDVAQVVCHELANASRETEAPATEEVVSVSRVPTSLATLSNFVRADLDKLDRLISSTHDLWRTTSTTLALSQMNAPVSDELHRLTQQIRSSFISLEDQLINLRLIPLGPTLQRAVRAGRAAARLAGKEVNFEISGSEIRLDKLLVESMADPLIHLVRNAVDHGIETVEQRTQTGKPARGTVRIEAASEGSQSRLRVTDDGRGVDPTLVSVAAQRLGLCTSDDQLDIERSLRLIFRPGFTTLTEASETSGRGVGLDAVETAIEQVGGELRVSSKPGLGTTFEILLPVTFGLVKTNVVVSAGNRYCIPTSQTLGIDAIDVVDGASGADQLRQVSMRDLLGQPDEPDDSTSQLHLVTCQFTDDRNGHRQTKCVGIVVDQVEGPQEVLVRTLGRHAGRWYGIAGATELRDGTVALVLDLQRLL